MRTEGSNMYQKIFKMYISGIYEWFSLLIIMMIMMHPYPPWSCEQEYTLHTHHASNSAPSIPILRVVVLPCTHSVGRYKVQDLIMVQDLFKWCHFLYFQICGSNLNFSYVIVTYCLHSCNLWILSSILVRCVLQDRFINYHLCYTVLVSVLNEVQVLCIHLGYYESGIT